MTTLAELTRVLGLHPLVVEDILESNQRAKIEVYADAIHIVMFGLTYEGEILAHEIDIVLGERYLLTSHDEDIDPRAAPFMKREEGFHLAGGRRLRAVGNRRLDRRRLFPCFRPTRRRDRRARSRCHAQAEPVGRRAPFPGRRDLLLIRHAVNPQREVFNQLTNRDSNSSNPNASSTSATSTTTSFG